MAEGLLGRCVAVVSGFRFICGVSACKLASHVIKNDGFPPQKVSFMDLCLRLVHLLPDQLFELGGWCVVLKEKQVIQIPPGYIVAETNTSPNSIATSWSWLGTEAMAEECRTPVDPVADTAAQARKHCCSCFCGVCSQS